MQVLVSAHFAGQLSDFQQYFHSQSGKDLMPIVVLHLLLGPAHPPPVTGSTGRGLFSTDVDPTPRLAGYSMAQSQCLTYIVTHKLITLSQCLACSRAPHRIRLKLDSVISTCLSNIFPRYLLM